MATRLVLNRARPFCNQLKGKLGLLGGISSYYSIVGRDYSLINPFPSSNYDCRRHCFLPPPHRKWVLEDFLTYYRIHPVDDAEINTAVIEAAEFAVRVQNKASSPAQGDNIIQFARVVRASQREVRSAHWYGVFGYTYFITLEALLGKADMNVYYAEVLQTMKGLFQTQMELIKWELVNESFSYPFEDYGSSQPRIPGRPRIAEKTHISFVHGHDGGHV